MLVSQYYHENKLKKALNKLDIQLNVPHHLFKLSTKVILHEIF